MTTTGIWSIALGAAALIGLPLSAAYADTPAPAGPNAPSLAEPAPTPASAEAGPAAERNGAVARQHRYRTRARHVVYRHEPSYARAGGNVLADTAHGVIGGVEDLGSVAAYPVYCFPNYGSCRVRLPYRP